MQSRITRRAVLAGTAALAAVRALPAAAADSKLRWPRYRDALAKGLALQLASYAATRRLETGAEQPLEAAYFALKSARGLSLRGSRFKHARGFDGDSLEETWARAERTTELVLATLAQGDIPTSANAVSREYVLAHQMLVPNPKII